MFHRYIVSVCSALPGCHGCTLWPSAHRQSCVPRNLADADMLGRVAAAAGLLGRAAAQAAGMQGASLHGAAPAAASLHRLLAAHGFATNSHDVFNVHHETPDNGWNVEFDFTEANYKRVRSGGRASLGGGRTLPCRQPHNPAAPSCASPSPVPLHHDRPPTSSPATRPTTRRRPSFRCWTWRSSRTRAG